MEFEFTLTLMLDADDSDVDKIVERLGAAGCTDALVGIGQAGRVALNFNREAESAEQAIRSALKVSICYIRSPPFPGLSWRDGM